MKWHKYGAKPTTIDGIRFSSKKESVRFLELKLLERAGEISNLELQPKFPIEINGVKICAYIADFRYIDNKTNLPVVEDVKGVLTPVYRLKKKLMKAIYSIDVVEV